MNLPFNPQQVWNLFPKAGIGVIKSGEIVIHTGTYAVEEGKEPEDTETHIYDEQKF